MFAVLPKTLPTGRRLLVGLASLLLLATACGTGSEAEPGAEVASIGERADDADPPVDVSDGLEAPENPEDAFELFNQCMAESGFDFGDSAGFAVSGDETDGLSVSSADALDGGAPDTDPQRVEVSPDGFDLDDFEAANKTCEGHLANVDQGFDLSPEEQARMEDAQLAFTECMREHGIDMPDLDAGGGFAVGVEVIEGAEGDPQTGEPSVDDVDFEAMEEAIAACDDAFGDIEADGAVVAGGE